MNRKAKYHQLLHRFAAIQADILSTFTAPAIREFQYSGPYQSGAKFRSTVAHHVLPEPTFKYNAPGMVHVCYRLGSPTGGWRGQKISDRESCTLLQAVSRLFRVQLQLQLKCGELVTELLVTTEGRADQCVSSQPWPMSGWAEVKTRPSFS